MKNGSVWSRSRLFYLEPQPTQFGRSQSRSPPKSGGSATLLKCIVLSFFGTKALTLTKVPNVFGLAEFDGKDC